MMRVGQNEYFLRKMEILNLKRRKKRNLKSKKRTMMMMRLEK